MNWEAVYECPFQLITRQVIQQKSWKSNTVTEQKHRLYRSNTKRLKGRISLLKLDVSSQTVDFNYPGKLVEDIWMLTFADGLSNMLFWVYLDPVSLLSSSVHCLYRSFLNWKALFTFPPWAWCQRKLAAMWIWSNSNVS